VVPLFPENLFVVDLAFLLNIRAALNIHTLTMHAARAWGAIARRMALVFADFPE
jgi:hypothetical protein